MPDPIIDSWLSKTENIRKATASEKCQSHLGEVACAKTRDSWKLERNWSGEVGGGEWGGQLGHGGTAEMERGREGQRERETERERQRERN